MTTRRITFLLITVFLASVCPAQKPSSRIVAAISDSQRVTLPGSLSPHARAVNDMGAVSPSLKLEGIAISFSRTDSQEAALQALIAAQQDPASPQYHQWLSPEQFGAQFGVSDADLAQVQSWLEQHGFSVDRISRSRSQIFFSGTASEFASAFGAELHNYTSGSETHFAPDAELTVPAALSGLVSAVNNISSFRPKPSLRFGSVKSSFTSSQTGSHFFTPLDIATTYDINAAYNAGYTGSGQSLAIVGQSAVVTSDITTFQSLVGLTSKAPTIVLVPNTGSSAIYSDDEAESDLDLEYSSSIARGATVYFVYSGSSSNADVTTALDYAIENKIAPVISMSYGECEAATTASSLNSMNNYLAQAASQGQSVIASSGDSGSSGCAGDTSLSTSITESLSVNWPASSQYVTAVGGTEITSANDTSSTYWASANGSDVVSSALSYIPEIAWNDGYSKSGNTAELGASGGGVSTVFARPAWQTGVTGISSGSYRLVPDVALYSSAEYPGYLYCSSDTSGTGITGSCSNGFRDSSGKNLTVAGGTSFAAPIFAGMIAIINQAKNSTGQGVLGSILYPLAANTTTYASAFHDIATGTNECPAASGICGAATETSYAAGVGYDEVTGLGSVDFNNLLNVWPSNSSSSNKVASTITATPATSNPAVGAGDSIAITVASASTTSATTPTGTASVTVDGSVVTTLNLTAGQATYTFSSSTSGSHTVTLNYSGDSVYATASITVPLTVGTVSSFTVAVANLTVAQGSSGSTTVTVTPSSSYTGTIKWTATTSSNLSDACYSISSLSVSGTTATTPLTIYTNSSACTTTGLIGLRRVGLGAAGLNLPAAPSQRGAGAGIAFAALLSFCLFGMRKRRFAPVCAVLALCAATMAVSGCGSGGSTSASTSTSTTTTSTSGANAAKGTYNITLTGTDSTNSTITASGSFTLTID